MEEIIIFSLEKTYEATSLVNEKLSFNLEKIESGYSSYKNMSTYNSLLVSVYLIFLFFIKTFLLRLSCFTSKEITDSYIEDKEYSIMITSIMIISFFFCSSNMLKATEASKEKITRRKQIGLWLFKLLIDIINSYKFIYFFYKFQALHKEIYSSLEDNFLHNEKLKSISLLIYYLSIDFLLSNTSSSFARFFSFIFNKERRTKIKADLERKLFFFIIRFVMFYLIYYKDFLLNFQVFEVREFKKSNELCFFIINLLLCRLE